MNNALDMRGGIMLPCFDASNTYMYAHVEVTGASNYIAV